MKKMLKTTLALVLSFAMLLCFAACDNGDVAPSSNPSSNNSLGGNTNNGTNNNANTNNGNTNNGNTTNNDATNNGATQTANTAEEVVKKFYIANCTLDAVSYVDCIADFEIAKFGEKIGCNSTNRNDIANALAANGGTEDSYANLTIRNIQDEEDFYTIEYVLERIESHYGASVANSISEVTRFEIDSDAGRDEITAVKENGIWKVFLDCYNKVYY